LTSRRRSYILFQGDSVESASFFPKKSGVMQHGLDF
jgi:hypothetical protein